MTLLLCLAKSVPNDHLRFHWLRIYKAIKKKNTQKFHGLIMDAFCNALCRQSRVIFCAFIGQEFYPRTKLCSQKSLSYLQI